MHERIPEEDYSWGMFSTQSSVTQLKPITISEYVQEAEEHRWALGDVAELVAGSNDQQEIEAQNLGFMLLGKSTSLRKIHGYFSQLESRKCCLHLGCQRSTSHSMRVVPTSVTVDDGSAKNSQPTSEVQFLETKELRAFKHAYLCAIYPVLAAPDPPSPLTPSPIIHEGSGTSSHLQRTVSFTSAGGVLSTLPSPSYIPLSSSAPLSRPLTPYSLHDSGVEESDETGLIPMETICEQLQRAFRLSNTAFMKQEHDIIKSYSKKSSQRVHPYNQLLAEELSEQLSVLERNSHPFYLPKNFITQNGYDLWQKQERTHISELLNKFWSSSLPFPRDSKELISDLQSVHEDYLILLKKLLVYESQFRQGSAALSASATFVPLSSASYRLLLEFGLRYGIGELYRKALLLQCLTSEYSPSVGYLLFMNNLVVTIHQMLPSNKTAVVMVKQEFDMLYSSLRVLKAQTCKALSQMKSLFPANKPAEGVELLLIVLRSITGLMLYLSPANVPLEKFDVCIKNTIQSIFKPAYEMFRSVAQEDLNRRREGDPDPRLLNILIQDIREDVNDYKTNFESTFEKYFSISKMAATSFYHFLMKDVESLSQVDLQNRPLVEIDLRMLALAYRLNTLDTDWAAYIVPQQQTWRASFLPNLTQWTSALRGHLQNLVLDAVAGDAYVSQKLDLPQPVLTYQTAVTPSDTRSISFSIVSISPSINSAFSSIRSTPHPVRIMNDCILEGEEVQLQENSDDLEDAEILDFGLTEYEMRPSNQKPQTNYDTRSLDLKNTTDKPLFFSAFRRYSLPVKLDAAKSNHQFTINQQYSDSGTSSKDNTQHQTDFTRFTADCRSPNLHSNEINIQGDITPTYIITSDSSDSEDIEKQEHDPSTPCKSEDEEFTFPPLKIVSQQITNNNTLSDFSKPVFSMPNSGRPQLSVTATRRYLLKTDAPHMSSRASSVSPDLAEDEGEMVESMGSDVSFPHPVDMNKAVMPVSGSVVDIIIMIQRLCGFSNTLANIMLAEHSLITGSRQFSIQSLRKCFSNSYGNDQSDLTGSFPLYERTMSSVSTKSSISAVSRRKPTISTDGDFMPGIDFIQEENISLQTQFSRTSEAESEISDLPSLMLHKRKLDLHLRMLKALCNLLVVYTSNMLCMDLCATPRAVAKRLIGPKLVEFIESQQIGGLIWGCRHQAEATYDCLFYFNRKTQLLSDRHEPVSQHMCTRLNNVFVCLHILDKYQKILLKAFNIKEDEEAFAYARENSMQGNTERRNSDMSEDFVFVNHHSVQDGNLMEDTLNSDPSSDNEDIQGCWSNQAKQIVEMTRQHIMSALTGMYRLLAYKLNLFVKDGLNILLHQKHSSMTVAQAVAPVTSFLQKYLDSLSTWLYHECFRRVLDNLWIFIVQGIEFHAEELKKSQTTASTLAHSWMLTVGHLIKFMNNNGKGIKKDLLLAQANNVIFRLQLYTLSTAHLVALFESLRDYYLEGDHLSLEENATRNPPAIIHRIHQELQSLRKSFSGAELVHWIIKNKDALPADLSVPTEHVTNESAITISQILLDQQFILEVDSECPTNSATPISFSAMEDHYPYPHVVIHSQLQEISSSQETVASFRSDRTIENVQIVEAEIHQTGLYSTYSSTQSVSESSLSNTITQNGHSQTEYYNKGDDHNEYQRGKSNIRTRNSSQLDGIKSGATTGNLYHSEFQGSAIESREIFSTDNQIDDSYLDGSIPRMTPFSSVTEVTFHSSNKKFMASTKKFYCIHQSILHQTANNGKPKSIQSESERDFHKLKSSQENLSLLEQCLTYKLNPITIATIIAGRRKSDSLARNFVKQLPRDVIIKLTKPH